MTCIFNVAATNTKWIQCILEVVFKLMFIEKTNPKTFYVLAAKYCILFAVGLIKFRTLFLKILRLGAF